MLSAAPTITDRPVGDLHAAILSRTGRLTAGTASQIIDSLKEQS